MINISNKKGGEKKSKGNVRKEIMRGKRNKKKKQLYLENKIGL